MTCVLDASALLALFHDERGADRVEAALEGALISTVNWAEVIQKSVSHGVTVEGMHEELLGTGVTFEVFTLAQAEIAGKLWSATRRLGLSLGDRACLALGLERSSPVMTADRAWKKLRLEVAIDFIR
ncbi:MAG: type II toxin-antitoxin system VapC family toxin [Sedimenticolaceae bacterium]